MDDKDRLDDIDNDLDPSSIIAEDDGSMLEPSFNSDIDDIEEDEEFEEIDDDEDVDSFEDDLDNNEEFEDNINDEEEDIFHSDNNSLDENRFDDDEDDYFDESSSDDNNYDDGSEIDNSEENNYEEKEEPLDNKEDNRGDKNTKDSSKDDKSREETEDMDDSSSDIKDDSDSISDTGSSDTSDDDLSNGNDSLSESNNKDKNLENEKTDKSQSSDANQDKPDNKDKDLKVSDKTDDKSSKKDEKNATKDNAKDGAKDATKDAAKDTAKDAAKDAAKDTAKDAAKDGAKDAAKDGAKNAAKEGAKNAAKEGAKEGAKNAAKNVSDAAAIADNAKDALKKGPKGLVGSAGIRTALALAENENPYVKAAAIVLKVLDALIGKDKVDYLLDKVGESLIRRVLVRIVLVIIAWFLPILLLIIGIYLMFAPLLDSLMEVDAYLRKFSNTQEKFVNLYKNGIFADSKTAFYQELDTLSQLYGDDLDETLLMATTFYTDMKNGYKTRYNDIGDIIEDSLSDLDIDDDGSYMTTFIDIMKKEIDSLEEEADSTYDESTGLLYTTGKVYRLRSLAGHMFSQDFLGDEEDYNYEEMTLTRWINKYGKYLLDTIKIEFRDLAISLATDALGAITTQALVTTGITLAAGGGPIGWVVGGLLIWAGYQVGQATGEEIARDIDNAFNDMKILINCAYLGYMSLKSIELDDDFTLDDWKDLADSDDWDEAIETLTDNITIKYYSYKYSEENYRNYLKEVYIPNIGEFEPYLSYGSNGEPTEASIDRVINEIFEYKTYFEQFFYVDEEDYSENYSQLCLGAIDKKLAAAMSMPVDINTSNCIDFSGVNGYGYSANGMLHNGIELNEKSTGNHEGDNVYSVMNDGTVVGSSFDGTMECVGGCLEIQYDYNMNGSVDQSTFEYSIVYKGLSTSSVTLSSGDRVTDKQIIGTIGSADESENMGMSSLYLEFRKADGTAIDSTNMIVKCSSAGVGDYEGATIIDIPQDFRQEPVYSVTCLGSDGWHYSGGKSNGYKCLAQASTVNPPSKAVHELWISQGAEYKNGIAYVVVDGVERYLAAVVPKVAEAGDVLNATLQDGTVLPLLVADTKGGDAQYEWGHALGSGVDVIEFEVDKDIYNSLGNVKTATWGIEWDSSSPVVSFSNNGSVFNGEFDTVSSASGGGSNISGNGLTLCASMYSGGKIEAYVNKAIEYANDNSIGYSMDTRNLNPNVDCSSFVYYSLVNSGILPDQGSAFDTTIEGDILKNNEFDELDYDSSTLQRGDIIVDPRAGANGHTVIYIGDGKQVAAHGNLDGVDGDSSGNEVNISNYSEGSHQYTKIYRLKASIANSGTDDIGESPVPYGTAVGSKLTTINGTNYVVVDTRYPGGVTGYQQMLKSNKIYQDAKSEWGNCCGGFSYAQACGLYKGVAVTQTSGKLSKCNAAGETMGCTSGWDHPAECFDSETAFTRYVIENIQHGHPVIINVTGKKYSEGLYSRHYVTAVGFKDGSRGGSYKDLVIIDSWDAKLKELSNSSRKIQQDGIEIDNHPCSGAGQNYAKVVQ